MSTKLMTEVIRGYDRTVEQLTSEIEALQAQVQELRNLKAQKEQEEYWETHWFDLTRELEISFNRESNHFIYKHVDMPYNVPLTFEEAASLYAFLGKFIKGHPGEE